MHCCDFRPEEAEDVLHTVYLKIFDGRAKFDERASFKTWLFAVIRHTAADERRRRWVRILGLGRYEKEHSKDIYAQDPAKALDGSLIRNIFLETLKKLPRQQREVLHLVFYQDMTIQEAADVMKISIGSARTHYERGKQRIRELLKNKEELAEFGF